MNKNTSDKNAIELAYSEFALIAPVVQGVFPDVTKTAYYRESLKTSLRFPMI